MSAKTIEQLENYENKWVALSEPDEEIVGSGNDLQEAEENARQHGYTGQITFFKVMPYGYYIPTNHAA